MSEIRNECEETESLAELTIKWEGVSSLVETRLEKDVAILSKWKLSNMQRKGSGGFQLVESRKAWAVNQ